MRKLLGVLLGLALVLGAIGFFRSWFTVTKTDEGTDTNINLKIDKQRIKDDVDMAKKKAGELGGGTNGQSVEDQGEANQGDEAPQPESY